MRSRPIRNYVSSVNVMIQMEKIPLTLRRGLGLLQGLLLTFGSMMPVQATIIQAGKDAKEDAHLEAMSHEAGKKHRNVVGIEMGTLGQSSYGIGTGVYIGLSADGKKGLILTAAHLIQGDPKQAASSHLPAVSLYFRPEIDLSETQGARSTGIPVQRAVLHPSYTYFDDFSNKDAKGEPVAHRMASHDLAILEFDALEQKRLLAWMEVTPAELYEGAGYTKPLLEGEIVGFGRFGTSNGPTLTIGGRIHAGKTRVTFDDWRGRTGFLHWSPLSEKGREANASSKSDANVYQFDRNNEETQVFSPLTKKGYRVLSHKNQALCASGDIGCPLFLNTSTGLKVAGLYSQLIVGESLLGLQNGKLRLFILQIFEPVKQSLPWIQAVREGGDGGGQVIKFKSAQ